MSHFYIQSISVAVQQNIHCDAENGTVLALSNNNYRKELHTITVNRYNPLNARMAR